jgi:hypothetical protein
MAGDRLFRHLLFGDSFDDRRERRSPLAAENPVARGPNVGALPAWVAATYRSENVSRNQRLQNWRSETGRLVLLEAESREPDGALDPDVIVRYGRSRPRRLFGASKDAEVAAAPVVRYSSPSRLQGIGFEERSLITQHFFEDAQEFQTELCGGAADTLTLLLDAWPR